MNSRERVLTALAHKEPDMVPIDFGAMRSSGIMAMAYNRLKEYLGMNTGETRVYDLFQMLADPELEIIDRMEGDVVQLHRLKPALGIKITAWKEWHLPDGSPCKVPQDFDPIEYEPGSYEIWDGDLCARMPRGALYFDMVRFPLEHAKSVEDVEKYLEENPLELIGEEEFTWLRENSLRLYENTDKAILGAFGGNILEGGQFAFGWQKFMTDILANREMIEYFLDRLVENYLENLRRYIEAVQGHVHIIQMGDDLGTQTGLQISPQLYRQVIKPRQAQLYAYIHRHSQMLVFLHSCGSIYEIIPDLIEIGVDILNPVQTSAYGMDPVWLKRQFGKHLTFWGGGCDTQSVLPRARAKEIREHVQERMRIFAPGGGFVFTQIHNIQANVPPENILALYEAAKEFRRYPLQFGGPEP